MASILIDKRLSNKLLSEWHPTKNKHINPDEITYGSYEYIWWLCPEGHEWGATSSERLKNNEECPKCLRLKKSQEKQKAKEEEEEKIISLREADPELARQWNYDKNGNLTPDNIIFDQEDWKPKWWKCSRGHEWEESIKNRLQRKSVCPYCSNKKACDDNCLATVYPDLAKQWYIFKTMYNQTARNPYETVYTSREAVYWICSEGHIWRESINLRIKNGKGCRKCELYKKSIAFHNPELAKEWHHAKNKDIYGLKTPEETTIRCNEKAWWICGNCGNEYKAMVKARHLGEAKCPNCYPLETTDKILGTKSKGKYQAYTDMEDQRILFENKLRESLIKNN